jgi:hypothetical protein
MSIYQIKTSLLNLKKKQMSADVKLQNQAMFQLIIINGRNDKNTLKSASVLLRTAFHIYCIKFSSVLKKQRL